MSANKEISQGSSPKSKTNLTSFFAKVWQKYNFALLAGTISFIICFGLIAAFFCRSYAIGTLKNQFEELEKNLQSVGYDYAYDDLRFYSFSPWQIMRAKNFKIYSLDETNFWQWNIDELNINVGLWNVEKARLFLGHNQSVQVGNEEKEIYISDSNIRFRLKHGKLKECLLSLEGINIKNLMSVESIQAQIKHQTTPILFGKLDIKGVNIDDMTGWPMNKQIDHLYLYTSLLGYWDEDVLISEAFYDWIDRGGYINVHKGILNWKPLIMVANGDIRFNEEAEPTISLNTASLALPETIDKLNENGFISNKGTFVVKLLLENKAIQQNPTDKYKTVVSPLKISPEEITLENIKLR